MEEDQNVQKELDQKILKKIIPKKKELEEITLHEQKVVPKQRLKPVEVFKGHVEQEPFLVDQLDKTLEEKKLTSTILPTKFFLCNTAIPFFIPLLLPLFKMNDLRYGLFLSSITRALTKLPGDSTSSSINFLN